MKKAIITVVACIFLPAMANADSYWTAERIFDIFNRNRGHIAFDSLGNMHCLFSEWQKEDYEYVGETLKVYGSRGFYVEFDNEGKLKLETLIPRSPTLVPRSAVPFVDNKLIISWVNLWSENMVILGDSGKIVSKNYWTASTETRIAFNKDGHIFLMAEHDYPGVMRAFSIALESIIDEKKVHLRGFQSIDDGEMHHYFGTSPADYALTMYDKDKLMVALRVRTFFKGTPEEVYTTKDRFMILRLNCNGEDIEKYEIIHPKLDGNAIINGASLPFCDFFKLADGSIFLYVGSRDNERVVYQVRFSKDGKLMVPEERVEKAASPLELIDNLRRVRLQQVLERVDINVGMDVLHLYGFDEEGEMYYAKRMKERKFKYEDTDDEK